MEFLHQNEKEKLSLRLLRSQRNREGRIRVSQQGDRKVYRGLPGCQKDKEIENGQNRARAALRRNGNHDFAGSPARGSAVRSV